MTDVIEAYQDRYSGTVVFRQQRDSNRPAGCVERVLNFKRYPEPPAHDMDDHSAVGDNYSVPDLLRDKRVQVLCDSTEVFSDGLGIMQQTMIESPPVLNDNYILHLLSTPRQPSLRIENY
jgi:hypothetical protein